LRETLPENAVLIADGTVVRPIHYLQQLDRWREDVQVFPPPQRATNAEKHPNEAHLAEALAAGRVFVVTPQRLYCPPWLLERYDFVQDGLVYRVVGRKRDQSQGTGLNDSP
jgi:hypothetical protein